MARTRLGIGGPSAAYAGFVAKEAAQTIAAVAHYLIQVRPDPEVIRVRPDPEEVEPR